MREMSGMCGPPHRRQQYVDIAQLLPSGAGRNLSQLSQMADRETGEIQKKSDVARAVSGGRHAGHQHLFDFEVTGPSQYFWLAADIASLLETGRRVIADGHNIGLHLGQLNARRLPV